jgi:hypothetical protein
MKTSILLVVLNALFFTTIANAQSSYEKVKGSGKIITEKRTTAGYDEIKVSGFFDVVLVSGKEGAITIEGEENLLPFVKVEVEENVLKIQTEKNVNMSTNHPIVLTVPFEQISFVSLSGSGDVKSKNTIVGSSFKARLSGSGDLSLDVKTTDFQIEISGSGDVVLTGNSDNFNSKISGSGDIDAINLASKNASLSLTGSGDMKVNCTESLTARVSGSGDIKYKGNPQLKDTKVSGSGEISKI